MKKKLLIVTFVFALFFGSANVYAATVLNTNIFDAIINGLASIKTFYAEQSKTEITSSKENNKKKMNDYLDSKYNTIIDDLNSYTETETNRANQELDDLFNQMKIEADGKFAEELPKIKEELRLEIDKELEKAKQDLLKEFEDKIKEKIKK